MSEIAATARDEALRALDRMSEPLGPFRSPEEAEEADRAWAAGAGAHMIDAFFDLLVRPPPNHAGRTPEDFEFEISRALGLLGAARPDELIRRASHGLSDPALRPTLIEVLGMIGDAEGALLLAPLVAPNCHLSEEEAVRLACALGEVGGDAAGELLERLRAHPAAAAPRVRSEIDIAVAIRGADRRR